jgi:ABC-2 type transport system permease protein
MSRKSNLLFSIVIIIIINILSNYFVFNIDLTEDKRFTLSSQSIKVLNQIDDHLTIKVYLEGDLPAGIELLSSSIEEFLIKCRKINYINFEFIDPTESNNEIQRLSIYDQLEGQGLYPTDLRISETSRKIIYPGAIIRYKDSMKEAVNLLENNSSFSSKININNSIEKIEFQIISTINKLVTDKKHSIAFLKGNGELRSEQLLDITESVNGDNNNLKYLYNVENFNIKEFEIDSITNLPNLDLQLQKLRRFKAIIIAKPTIPFNKIDKLLIDQYIMHGGRLLILLDGVHANIDSLNNSNGYFMSSKNNLNIDDQLFRYGVRINSNLIQDLRSTEIPVITGYSNNKPIQEFYKWPYYPLLSNNTEHPISKNIDQIKCDFVSSIDTLKNNIKKTIILSSSKRSREIPAPSKISLSILENPPPIETFKESNIPIGVLLNGKFTSVFKDRIIQKNNSIEFKNISDSTKMIIVADGDIISNPVSNTNISYPLGYDRFINYTYEGNKKFIMNSIQYLCDENGVINLKSKNIKLRMLNNEKIQNHKNLIILTNIILPIIIFLSFILIINLFYRRKYD